VSDDAGIIGKKATFKGNSKAPPDPPKPTLSYDWRTTACGKQIKIINQGSCGSCYACAASQVSRHR